MSSKGNTTWGFHLVTTHSHGVQLCQEEAATVQLWTTSLRADHLVYAVMQQEWQHLRLRCYYAANQYAEMTLVVSAYTSCLGNQALDVPPTIFSTLLPSHLVVPFV